MSRRPPSPPHYFAADKPAYLHRRNLDYDQGSSSSEVVMPPSENSADAEILAMQQVSEALEPLVADPDAIDRVLRWAVDRYRLGRERRRLRRQPLLQRSVPTTLTGAES